MESLGAVKLLRLVILIREIDIKAQTGWLSGDGRVRLVSQIIKYKKVLINSRLHF